MTTLAGSALQSGTNDGTGSTARFFEPYGVAVDSATNVYVADTRNYTIRLITPVGTNWVVTTLAGSAGQYGTNDGTGSAARFDTPLAVAVDTNGNVYVTDTSNYTIRKITPIGTNWVVTTLAGSALQIGSTDGIGSAARFGGSSGHRGPNGLVVDNSGNVYVADTQNHTIRKITPAGAVTTLAGSAGQFGSADGTGSAARFFKPRGIAVDSAGTVYVADAFNQMIRKITPVGTNWIVTTMAGPGQSGSADGIGSAARFNYPSGLTVNSGGYVYVADSSGGSITKGTPLLQFVTTAGSLTVPNDFFQMRLTGPFGSNVVVEASADLAAWTPIQTNVLSSFGLDVSVPLDPNQNQFFRARLAP